METTVPSNHPLSSHGISEGDSYMLSEDTDWGDADGFSNQDGHGTFVRVKKMYSTDGEVFVVFEPYGPTSGPEIDISGSRVAELLSEGALIEKTWNPQP